MLLTPSQKLASTVSRNNDKPSRIRIFDHNKKETKNEIEILDDIFNHSEILSKTIETYKK